MQLLDGVRILAVTVNLPGPLAAARLREFGASVVKVEPPAGDPLEAARPAWYRDLHRGQTVLRLDLKEQEGQSRLHDLLSQSELLLTSLRPAALERLGLAWDELHARYPQISQAAIVGYPPPDDDRPGHDLGYQARSGLVQPPHLPIALIADLAGAQEAVTAVLGLLLARQRGGEAGFVQVSLAEAASRFAEPLRYGLTLPEGELGGRLPGYNLYRCRRGWVAVTALETQLYTRLSQELGLSRPTRQALAEVFARRPATEWEDWAVLRGLPLVAVRDVAGDLYVGEGSCHD